MTRAGRYVAPVLLVWPLSLPCYGGRYWLDLGILVLTYIMLGWGLNIVVGLAGLLDLGYVAFYAVGAYSYALLATTFDLGFWTCLPLAGLLAACWGVMLGFPVLRLRGDYLAIVTLAFGEIIRIVLINWVSPDRRPERHLRHPPPDLVRPDLQRQAADPAPLLGFFGIELSVTQRFIFLYYVILALALLTNWVSLRLRRLPLGPRLGGVARGRDRLPRARHQRHHDEAHRLRHRRHASAGSPGRSSPPARRFISPESFTFMESATVLAIVVLGGLGSQLGVALAALVMIGGTGAVPRVRRLPHAGVRRGAGGDDGAAAARPGLRPRALGVARHAEGNRRRTGRAGPGLSGARCRHRCSRSTASPCASAA